MSFFASALAAFIPMMVYLIFIWKLDKYEREPFGKVLRHFVWGAFGAVLFSIILSTFLNSTFQMLNNSERFTSFIAAVIVAPISEELVKSAYLFRSYKKDFFDNITDGLVYGGAIGLGFGMTENLMYFTSYDETFTQWIIIVISRSIFSAVMHAIATATVGAFLAKAKFTLTSLRFIYPIIGLLFAMFFHAAWNFSLTFEFTYYLGLAFMVFLISGFLIVFNSSLRNEKIIIASQLKDEFDGLPLNELSKKFSTKKERKKIINFATKLAFRKLQSIKSKGTQQEKYLADISTLREKINLLLKTIET